METRFSLIERSGKFAHDSPEFRKVEKNVQKRRRDTLGFIAFARWNFAMWATTRACRMITRELSPFSSEERKDIAPRGRSIERDTNKVTTKS